MSVPGTPERHDDRARRQFDAPPAIVTTVIRQWEDDVRALLYFVDANCDQPPALVRTVRRLRLLVGVLVLALFLPAPASAGDWGDRLYQISKVTALGAHGADGFSTMYCLAKGLCHETNPWLERFSTQPAIFGASVGTVAGVGNWATDKIGNKTIATIVNFGITGFLTGVAIHNTQVVRQVERRR